MKKKLILMSLLTAIILTACNSGYSTKTAPTSEVVPETTTTESSDALSDIESVGEIAVDEGLFDVELSIPAEFVGETTQEELNAIAEENGYKSITLNEDGSATYVMTKKQHGAMMDEMAASLNEALSEIIGSEDYPNITDIKTNDNFTEFTITTKSTELEMNESFATMAFYMYGGMYNTFAGESVDNIHVEFVNADSGEVISTADSKNMGE